MRKTEANGSMGRSGDRKPKRAMWLTAFAIGLAMAAGPVSAADDDDDDKTFEEKIIENIMRGIGGTNMENRGIEYRERSPLVVPPKLDLPPPSGVAAETKAPNWPKDPDEQRRKAAVEARKKASKDPREAARTLLPSELAQKGTGKSSGTEPVTQPGALLSPSQLGYDGGILGMFRGNKTETAPFKGEPTRDTLTQPPPGYQTPSPNFAYGTGPKESLNKEYNPAAGKHAD